MDNLDLKFGSAKIPGYKIIGFGFGFTGFISKLARKKKIAMIPFLLFEVGEERRRFFLSSSTQPLLMMELGLPPLLRLVWILLPVPGSDFLHRFL